MTNTSLPTSSPKHNQVTFEPKRPGRKVILEPKQHNLSFVPKRVLPNSEVYFHIIFCPKTEHVTFVNRNKKHTSIKHSIWKHNDCHKTCVRELFFEHWIVQSTCINDRSLITCVCYIWTETKWTDKTPCNTCTEIKSYYGGSPDL